MIRIRLSVGCIDCGMVKVLTRPLWAVPCEQRRPKHPGIMRHNAAWDRASCRINLNLYPKPSEHPPGGHKVKSTTPDPRESGSGEEVRQEAEHGCWCCCCWRWWWWQWRKCLLLSVSAACCPQPCSSRLDFSQHAIYYLADLLKVISEPSGPARWPEKEGASEWPDRLENLNGHSGTAKTHKLKTNSKHYLHY